MSEKVGRKRIPMRTPEAEVLAKIKSARHSMNMSQGDVAKRLEVSQQAYSDWERGATTLGFDVLLKLPEIFQVSIADLLPSSIVTAVDQRRSKDFRLEEIIMLWPDISEGGKQNLLNTARLIADAELARQRAQAAYLQKQRERKKEAPGPET